ncbi:DUF1232 domain-containing protein [bacterium]|nr:DUF1232 domain-containing protein [bacterium]MCI0603180.1 DUF1232 domain-containing protein [bacterium]
MNSSTEYEVPNSSSAGVKALTAGEPERIRERLIRYARTVMHFARLLIGLLMDSRVDKKVKIFVGAVLAYIFAPIDFIPEIFSGLFGMLDDFVLSAFALNVILNWVDPAIVRSHWVGEKDLLETVQKGMKNAEVLVPEPIVKKIQMWIGRHVEKALVPVETPKKKPRKKKTDTVQ